MFPVTAELNVLGTQELTTSYQESVNYIVESNTGGSYLGGSYPTPATPGATWAISGLNFMPSISVNRSGQTASALEEFCLNAAFVTNCPTADFGVITVTFTNIGSSITCLGTYCASADGTVVNFPIPVTQVAIGFNVAVNGATLGGVILNDFDTEFSGVAVPPASATPEPPTFLIVVIGLASLVYVRRAGSSTPFARAIRY